MILKVETVSMQLYKTGIKIIITIWLPVNETILKKLSRSSDWRVWISWVSPPSMSERPSRIMNSRGIMKTNRKAAVARIMIGM